MKYQLSRLLACAVMALPAVGCKSDDEATVWLPDSPIAVGAHYPLSVSDACRGGGKISFCTSEEVVSVDSIRVGDAAIAQVMRMDELTEALRIDYAELVVYALRPGKTALGLETTFNDGSKRHIDTAIGAARADKMELVHGCSVKGAQDLELFPAHRQVNLRADLYHGSTLLLGEHLDPLVTAVGLEQLNGGLRANNYRWTTPNDAGVTTITSPLITSFVAKLRTYKREQLKCEGLVSSYDLSTAIPAQSYFALEAKLTVNGKKPCEVPPLHLQSLSPEVCVGPDGSSEWSADPSWSLSLRAVSTGTCRLVVGVEATDATYPFDIALAVTPAVATDTPVVVPDPCQDVTCPVAVASCPAGSELTRVECCDACSPVVDAAACEVERLAWDPLYDAQLASATSCVFDADCTSWVLVGGCRRYCHVLLSTKEIMTFMNAISQTYYTGCPSCAAGTPASCGARPPVYCDAGHCRFAL